MEPKVYYRSQEPDESSQHVSTLFLKTHYHIILQRTFYIFQAPLPFRLSDQNFIRTSYFCYPYYMPLPFRPFDSIWKYLVTNKNCEAPYKFYTFFSAWYCFPFLTTNLFSLLFSNTVNLWDSLRARDQSHTNTKRQVDNFIGLCVLMFTCLDRIRKDYRLWTQWL